MIHGVGVDIVAVDRLDAAHRRWGERFARRVLAPSEVAEWRESQQPARFLAKRFAVKEAASKALGTGMARGVSLRDIAVTHDALGKPGIRFHGAARTLTEELGITGTHVSISDERHLAAAFVVLEVTG